MVDFWSGKDSRVVLMQADEQVVLDVLNWNAKPNGVKAADGVCGETRDRLQFITNFYELTLSCKQTKTDALVAFLTSQANLDAGVSDLQRGVYMLINPLDGTQAAYQATQVTLDDWDFRADGRTERNQLNVPLRAREFSALPTL
jgi:hypothetical protein